MPPIEREAEDARRRRLKAQADERTTGIEQEKLHQKGRAANDFDINPQQPAQRRDGQAIEQRNRSPDDRGRSPNPRPSKGS